VAAGGNAWDGAATTSPERKAATPKRLNSNTCAGLGPAIALGGQSSPGAGTWVGNGLRDFRRMYRRISYFLSPVRPDL